VSVTTLPLAGIAAAPAAYPVCAHCGQPAPASRRFCCPGCEAAFGIVQDLGLGRYYRQRSLDAAIRPLRPEATDRWDLAQSIVALPDGTHELTVAVDGLQCGACVWLIEQVLAREPGLRIGRVNMTTRRLRLVWTGPAADASRFVSRIEALGYRLVPFTAALLGAEQDRTGRMLLRALAVAGFAAGNVMMISIGIWAGQTGRIDTIGPATVALLHWISALIAMPAVAYAGRPFFASALAALAQRRTNMDVPISLGVLLVTGMSLWETIAGGAHTYFDSAVTLLFFLLIGRVLDHRARGKARATAEQLLTLRSIDVAVIAADGTLHRRPQAQVAAEDRVLVAAGERIGVDGVIEQGNAPLDASLMTGESMPVNAGPGTAVYAGTLNLGGALTVRATATGDSTLLAECVRLIDAAEARRGRFVVLADRVASRYAPAVHLCALLTFLGWYGALGVPVTQALLIATSVLIITCPCALALAVPAVQVIATGRLFRDGMLLKSPTALERLAAVDTIVFDKTGTLTEPLLALSDYPDTDTLNAAAALAACSRHPLARSLVAAAGRVTPADGVVEHPGQGLSLGDVRLGSRSFCRIGNGWVLRAPGTIDSPMQNAPGAGDSLANAPGAGDGIQTADDAADAMQNAADPGDTQTTRPELWFARPGQAPARFGFNEVPRPDAGETIARLQAMGYAIRLLSGDRPSSVARIADALKITERTAACSPAGKVAAIEALRQQGRSVLMVGDGLNDSPALAAANISASPASAADVSQTVADLVFQGRHLAPVATALVLAKRSRRAMQQNLALSIGYNIVMVPLAVAGWVTPWLAAAAMSSSSLLVMANSLRLHRPVKHNRPSSLRSLGTVNQPGPYTQRSLGKTKGDGR